MRRAGSPSVEGGSRRKPRLFRIELRGGDGKLIMAASALFPQGWRQPQIKRRLIEIAGYGSKRLPQGASWVFPASPPPASVPTMPRNEPARTAALRRKYGKEWDSYAA